MSAVNGQGSWLWNPARTTNVTVRYDYTRTATHVVPFFANRVNVSENAGITGNDQDPRNWGPPSLTFGGDVAGLADGLPRIPSRFIQWRGT